MIYPSRGSLVQLLTSEGRRKRKRERKRDEKSESERRRRRKEKRGERERERERKHICLPAYAPCQPHTRCGVESKFTRVNRELNVLGFIQKAFSSKCDLETGTRKAGRVH